MTEKIWFSYQNNNQEGPFSEQDIWDFISSGKFNYEQTYLFKEGMDDWTPLSKLSEFERRKLESHKLNQEIPSSNKQAQEPPQEAQEEPSNDHQPAHENAQQFTGAAAEPTTISDTDTVQVWTVFKNENQIGPYTTDELQIKLNEGEISFSDFCWTEGLADWIVIGDLDQFDRRKEEPSKKKKKTKGFDRKKKIFSIVGLLLFVMVLSLVLKSKKKNKTSAHKSNKIEAANTPDPSDKSLNPESEPTKPELNKTEQKNDTFDPAIDDATPKPAPEKAVKPQEAATLKEENALASAKLNSDNTPRAQDENGFFSVQNNITTFKPEVMQSLKMAHQEWTQEGAAYLKLLSPVMGGNTPFFLTAVRVASPFKICLIPKSSFTDGKVSSPNCISYSSHNGILWVGPFANRVDPLSDGEYQIKAFKMAAQPSQRALFFEQKLLIPENYQSANEEKRPDDAQIEKKVAQEKIMIASFLNQYTRFYMTLYKIQKTYHKKKYLEKYIKHSHILVKSMQKVDHKPLESCQYLLEYCQQIKDSGSTLLRFVEVYQDISASMGDKAFKIKHGKSIKDFKNESATFLSSLKLASKRLTTAKLTSLSDADLMR